MRIETIATGVAAEPGRSPAESNDAAIDYPLRPQKPWIVVAAWNNWPITQKCLESIAAYSQAIPVVLVDDGSEDATRIAESMVRPWIRVVHHDANRGVAPAWNTGIRYALKHGADCVVLLNNDARLTPRGLVPLLDAMTYRRRIVGQTMARVNQYFRWNGRESDPERAHYVDGAVMAIGRDVFETIGLFDERLVPAYCEDTEFCIRARQAGFRFAEVPGVIDHPSPGSSTLHAHHVEEHHLRNQRRLMDTYGDSMASPTIVIRRWAAMGDVIMAMTAIAGLRRQHPYARIILQCHPRFHDLFRYVRCLDAITTTVGSALARDSRMIDLDGVYENAERRGDYTHPARLFCDAAGVYYAPQPYPVVAHPHDDYFARNVISEPERTIALGVRSVHRRVANWTPDGWIRLIADNPDWRFVILDPNPFPTIARSAGPNVIDLAGMTTPRQALAVIQRCAACITVDTGILHLAGCAPGTPVVGLMAARPWGSRQPPVSASIGLTGAAACYPCLAVDRCPRIDTPEHCLAGLTADTVMDAVKRLLSP